MGTHARLSPSNHRWPHCPGSVREEARYPDIPGEAAIDGTGSHLLLELCLKNNCRAEQYDGQRIGVGHEDNSFGWVVHPDRAERVQQCLDYISTRVANLRRFYGDGYSIKVYSESKSNPGEEYGRDDWYGTLDVCIVVANTHNRVIFLEVIDYKDGRGYVDQEDNTQLLSYAVGKVGEFAMNTPSGEQSVKVTVVQPKLSPPVRSTNYTLLQILEEGEKLSNAATRTDAPDAPLIPDDKGGKGYCTWCKHKPNCTALADRDIQRLNVMSSDLPQESKSGELFELSRQLLANPANMTDQQLTSLADMEAGVLSMFAKAKEEIQRRLEHGDAVRGWRMRPGRASKVWALSEEEIAKKLIKGRRLKKDVVFPSKLISPAQCLALGELTKEQKDNIAEELIVEKVGELRLTRVSDDTEVDAFDMFMDAVAPAPESKPKVSFLEAPQEEPAKPKVSFL